MTRKLIGFLPADATEEEIEALITATLASVKADEAAKPPGAPPKPPKAS